MMVVKRDSTRELFDRSKIEAGLVRACHKRPISANEITEVVDRIENEIMQRDSREIPSTEVGELVLKHLRQLDDVAYVRFASVYREFQDVDTFLEEILKLAKKS